MALVSLRVSDFNNPLDQVKTIADEAGMTACDHLEATELTEIVELSGEGQESRTTPRFAWRVLLLFASDNPQGRIFEPAISAASPVVAQ
jgi:hypothetical protein